MTKNDVLNLILNAKKDDCWYLSLRNNDLVDLPSEIGQLTKLQTLDLSDNRLTSLPKEIGLLADLKVLILNGNQLTSLPSEIGQLEELSDLSLYKNKLVDLPREIGQLIGLRRLYASYNQLESLSDEMGQMISLSTLTLDNNRLKKIPESIRSLATLGKLDRLTYSGNFIPGSFFKVGKYYKHKDGHMIYGVVRADTSVLKDVLIIEQMYPVSNNPIYTDFCLSSVVEGDIENYEESTREEWVKLGARN